MLKTRQQRRTDYATTAPMQTARPRASRSSPEAALRCAEGAGLDGDPHGRATLGRAVWCGATSQPPTPSYPTTTHVARYTRPESPTVSADEPVKKGKKNDPADAAAL